MIIQIIALKGRQYWQKVNKMEDNTESKRNDPYTRQARNILTIDEITNVKKDTLKVVYSKFVVRAKIRINGNFQKSEKLAVLAKFGLP